MIFFVETDPDGEPTEVDETGDSASADGAPFYDIAFYGTAEDLVAVAWAVMRRERPHITAQDFARISDRGKVAP